MNTRSGSLSLRLALLAPLLVQCSLTVGGFEIPTCRLQSDCEVLNTEGHIAADACARYACSATSHQCVLTSDGDGDGEARAGCGGNDCDDTPGLGILRTHGRAEDPDGVDNNCNTIIDEGVWISPSQDLGASTGVPATLSAARRSPAAGGLAVMTTDAASGAALGFVTDGAPAAMPVTWRTVYTESERSVAMPGWPTGTPDAPSVGGGARFADLVAQPLSDTLWIAAAVNNAGCGPGRLYVATFDPAQRALTLDFRRAPRGAPIWRSGSVPSLRRVIPARPVLPSRWLPRSASPIVRWCSGSREPRTNAHPDATCRHRSWASARGWRRRPTPTCPSSPGCRASTAALPRRSRLRSVPPVVRPSRR
ncbi:MAG: hypothetical protein IPF99_35310 [Deltaproteobacteria bacterium]|nr:hypothetical protein [Deltaproteobacteria bacterium]